MTLVPDRPAPAAPPTGHRLIDRIADGDVVVEPGILQRAGLLDELMDGIHRAIRQGCGGDRQAAVARDGLDRLHEHLDMVAVHRLFVDVQSWLARDWRRISPPVCRALFGERPVHIVGDLGLRLLVPEAVSKGHENLTNQFGGRLSPAPPHRDSWGSTPMSAINVWAALTPKNGAYGLYVHPDRWRQPVRRRRPYVLDPDDALGRQIGPEAAPGDAVLFGGHHIHGGRANRSDRTQVLIAFNVTPAPPRYSPEGRNWYPYIRSDHAGGPLETVDRWRSAMSAAYLRRLGLLPARWWRDPTRKGWRHRLRRAASALKSVTKA